MHAGTDGSPCTRLLAALTSATPERLVPYLTSCILVTRPPLQVTPFQPVVLAPLQTVPLQLRRSCKITRFEKAGAWAQRDRSPTIPGKTDAILQRTEFGVPSKLRSFVLKSSMAELSMSGRLLVAPSINPAVHHIVCKLLPSFSVVLL